MNPLMTTEWALTTEAHSSLAERAKMPVTRELLEAFAKAREQALAVRDGRPLAEAPGVELRGDVAVLRLHGPLTRGDSFWAWLFGGSSYEGFARDFTAAIESPQVRALLIDVDSPGGDVNSCNELSDLIYAARGRKPIEAFIGGTCASGGFWVGSACDRLTCAETALVGSIGVLYKHLDDREFEAKIGVREITIRSRQSPRKCADPTTDEGRRLIQARVDELADVFIATVARNRGVSVKDVLDRFGQGDVLVGASAVEAGLADQLGSFESVLADLQGRPTPITFQPARVAAAIQENKMAMKCAECGEDLKDPAYCGNCYDDSGEDAKALGLDAAATIVERRARARALCALERDLFAATGAVTADQAVGRVSAWREAAGRVAHMEEERTKGEVAARHGAFKSLVTEGVETKRLTLGELARVVPTFFDAAESEKMRASIEAMPAQTAANLIDAICSVQVSEQALERTKAFLEAKASAFPTARREPALDEHNRAQVVSVSKDEAAKFGLKPESVSRFYNVHSVDQIERPAQGAGAR
jgi:signal peptide peptidase SppA